VDERLRESDENGLGFVDHQRRHCFTVEKRSKHACADPASSMSFHRAAALT
jgi:hypothetical protein